MYEDARGRCEDGERCNPNTIINNYKAAKGMRHKELKVVLIGHKYLFKYSIPSQTFQI